MSRTVENWDFARVHDFGMINKINSSILRSRYNPRNGGFEEVKKLISRQYEFNILPEHHGPHLAVVLKVLNDGADGIYARTKSYRSFLSDDSPGGAGTNPNLVFSELNRSLGPDGAKRNLTRVIAKVPDYDIDLPWPETAFDRRALNLHGEYWAQSTDKQFSNLKAGQVILVVFNNTTIRSAAADGEYSGLIVGVPTARFMNSLAFASNNAVSSFEPVNCPSPRLLIGPTGKKVVVETKSDMPTRFLQNIKSKIKTGIYGDGTIQTKTHFSNCLSAFTISHKNKINSPAPGPSSAFIWVGHLRSNGPLDLLDRAMSKGRETIIYAPRHFDINAPFEIKYYLHDFAGFGRAWIEGPDTAIDKAAKADPELGGPNDFVTKIAPAINDMIKDKRNFILVIPELMHSMGFGTGNTETGRVSALANGELFSDGNHPFKPEFIPQERLRSTPLMTDPQMRAAVFGYLNTMSAKVGEKLSTITLLTGRSVSSFTAGYTSGDFQNFHSDVLEILEQYLGVDYSLLDYTHLIGDNAGALTIASMGSTIAASESHNAGQDSFNSMIAAAKVRRIDFIDRGSANQTLGLFEKVPPVQFYEDFLSNLSTPLEFNYVTFHKGGSSVGASRTFFDLLPPEIHVNEFSTNYTAGVDGFAFSLNNGPGTINLLLHKPSSGASTDAATGLCFSYKSDNDQAPVRPAGSYTYQQPSTTPNHAGALQRSSGNREVAERLEKITNRNVILSYFETALQRISTNGLAAFCNDDESVPQNQLVYQKYCENGIVNTQQGGIFAIDHSSWIENRFGQLKDNYFLIPFYTQLSQINSEDDFKAQIEEYKAALEEAKKEIKESPEINTSVVPALASLNGATIKKRYDLLKTFNKDYWTSGGAYQFMLGVDSFNSADEATSLLDPAGGFIGEVLYANAKAEAYEEMVKALESKKEDFAERNKDQRVATSFDCKPNSKRISELGVRRQGNEGKVGDSVDVGCSGLTVQTIRGAFRNTRDIVSFLPYTPSSSDFEPFEKISNVRVSKNNTGIKEKISQKYSEFGKTAEAADFKGIETIVRVKDNAQGRIGAGSKRSVKVFGCIARLISESWAEATRRSGYLPFRAVNGLVGDLGVEGITAYSRGVSPFAYGLAITIDPFLCLSVSPENMTNSIWTGAWTPSLTSTKVVVEQLMEYGVFKTASVDNFRKLAFTNVASRQLRDVGALNQAFVEGAYNVDIDDINKLMQLANDNSIGAYGKISRDAAGSSICPVMANPTKWMVEFCERSGMRWYNSFFLKKRWNQGSKKWIDIQAGTANDFTSREKNFLSRVYDIPNIVERVRAVSVDFRKPYHRIDKHAQFMFTDLRTPYIPFSEIVQAKNAVDAMARAFAARDRALAD